MRLKKKVKVLIRIQKFLSQNGITSRRKAEELIKNGKVLVNNLPAVIGQKVDPQNDVIFICGKKILPQKKFIYIALNKPVGYISSLSNRQGPSILNLIKSDVKVYPVGRLDKDSEGLMLLTNDGELANFLMHPRYGCEKEYIVEVNKDLTSDEMEKFRNGIELDDGRTKKCFIKRIKPKKYKIILQEGKKRQIRRMFKYFGVEVLRLKRVRIKTLKLNNLKVGRWRFLSEDEVIMLKNTANGS